MSKCSTSRLIRSLSLAMSLAAAVRTSSGTVGPCASRSAFPRIVVSGVRSSCEASATKRRCASSAAVSCWLAASTCSSIRLKLSLSSPISSRRCAGGSRRFKSRVRAIESAVSMTVLSGRSARPVINQLAMNAASNVGMDEMTKKPRMPRRLLDWMLVGWPATTKPARPRSARVQRVARRRSDGAPARSTVARALPCSAADASRLAGTAGAASPILPLLDSTVPVDVRTSMNGSVRRVRSSAPVSVPGALSWLAGAAAIAAWASAARCLRASSCVVPWVLVASV